MSIYERKTKWKLYLLIVAFLIVAVSLLYTNILSRKIASEEKKRVELWASAYKHLNLASDSSDIGFLFEIITNNETVPVILTDDEGNIKAWRNLDSSKALNSTAYLKNELQDMSGKKEPIEIEISENDRNYIYYKDSYLLSQLRYYPFIQLGVIGLFLVAAYLLFNTSRRAEQNQVWVGMAKETAHQLGTPISSLAAWMEYLRTSNNKRQKIEEIIPELDKDINRLELVAERFSKIGSKPDLEETNLKESLEHSVDYIKRRSSNKVSIKFDGSPVKAFINPPLFEWVIENLLKNALDAIEGDGNIDIKLFNHEGNAIVEVRDSGKGIPKSKFKTVFLPGYSTKKRGWGLGLSLTKRIIEVYHSGKIYVKESAVGQGTTFKIVLPQKV